MTTNDNPGRDQISCPYCPDRLYQIEEDEIGLFDLFRVIVKHIGLLTLFIFICLAFSLAYLFSAENLYQAKATIMPVQGAKTINIPFFQQLKELDEIKNILAANLPVSFQDPNTTTIRAVLQSRSFNIYLVEKYNLLPKLFDGYWNKKEQKWMGEGHRRLYPEPTIKERIFGRENDFYKYAPTSIDGAELLLGKLKVEKSKPQSDWLELRFEDRNPAFAAAMLNNYITELDYYLRNKEIERSTANQTYLQALIKTQKNEEIRQGLNRVIIGQIESAMFARVASDFAFKTVDPPLIPQQAYKPRRLHILLLTFAVSLFGGILLVFFIEYIGNVREWWGQVRQTNS